MESKDVMIPKQENIFLLNVNVFLINLFFYPLKYLKLKIFRVHIFLYPRKMFGLTEKGNSDVIVTFRENMHI
jgi:hypothetical protein